MANLYSQYASGAQFTAGVIAGSATGVSGLNPIVDRLNSISDDDGIYSNLGSGTGIDINTGSVVALRNKESYWSCNGYVFQSAAGTGVTRSFGGKLAIDSSTSVFAVVNLPNGAVVTKVVVYGIDTGESWGLRRTPTSDDGGGVSTLASANLDTEDTTISAATIDNSGFNYSLDVLNLDAADEIHGARITYTTDYI